MSEMVELGQKQQRCCATRNFRIWPITSDADRQLPGRSVMVVGAPAGGTRRGFALISAMASELLLRRAANTGVPFRDGSRFRAVEALGISEALAGCRFFGKGRAQASASDIENVTGALKM
jgi:hypothetical protein